MSHKVGIIGIGGISRQHYMGYKASGANVVAIADINPKALAERQKEWDIPHTYTEYEELLARPDIEAVSICAPNAVHHPASLAAAKAGKHVLCEKPLSLSLELAKEIIASCKQHKVILQVGHHMRSNPAASKAKTLIDNGVLGDITFARFRQAHDWGGADFVRDSFGKRSLSGGGTMLDNGCHMFDLARYFCGEVKSIYAQTATLKFDIEVEDTATANLSFASGALGAVESAWTATGWEEAFWLFGTKGSLEYNNRWERPVLKHRFRQSGNTAWADTDTAMYDFQTEGSYGNHAQHIANFLASIRGEREVICTGEDGLHSVGLVLAGYESQKKNSPIDLVSFMTN